MKKIICCFLLIISCLFAYAQKVFVFKGLVIDAATREPLTRATIISGDSKFHEFTNDSGQFTFITYDKNSELHVSYVGYDSVVIRVNSIKNEVVTISLKQSSSILNEVEVLPELPKYLFFGSKETEVIDYVFWMDKTLIAVYNFHRKKCYLILMDRNNEIIAEQPIAANLGSLYMSCINKTYAVMSDGSVCEILTTSKGIEIKPFSTYKFYRKVLHYVDFYENYFYVFDEGKSKQDRLYRIENTKETSLRDLVYVVHPETAIKARNSDRKIKADRLKETQDLFPVYDPKAEGDFLQDFNTLESKRGFVEKQWFKQQFIDKPVYAPLFVHDSTVMVFDLYQNLLLRFHPGGEVYDSLAIGFHKQPDWQPWIYRDLLTEKYYTSYLNDERKLTIKNLDVNTCETTPSTLLYYPSVEKVKVRKGYIYYLHQPSEKFNNVFLFRQKTE